MLFKCAVCVLLSLSHIAVAHISFHSSPFWETPYVSTNSTTSNLPPPTPENSTDFEFSHFLSEHFLRKNGTTRPTPFFMPPWPDISFEKICPECLEPPDRITDMHRLCHSIITGGECQHILDCTFYSSFHSILQLLNGSCAVEVDFKCQGNSSIHLPQDFLKEFQDISKITSANCTFDYPDRFFSPDPRLCENAKGYFRNITRLSLVGANLKAIPDLAFCGYASLNSLNLEFNKIDVINATTFAGLSNSLERLILNHNLIKNIPSYAFQNIPNLRELHLSDNLLQTLGPQAFADVRNLSLLNLDHNQLTEIDSSYFCDSIPNLKTLRLYANNIISVDEEMFRCLKDVRLISMGRNPIQYLPPLLFNFNRHLEKVDLRFLKLKDISGPLLALPNLTSLALQGNHLQQFPSHVAKYARGLKILFLDANFLSSIPTDSTIVPKDILLLGLSDNNFQDWIGTLQNISSILLRDVNLSRNVSRRVRLQKNPFGCRPLNASEAKLIHNFSRDFQKRRSKKEFFKGKVLLEIEGANSCVLKNKTRLVLQSSDLVLFQNVSYVKMLNYVVPVDEDVSISIIVTALMIFLLIIVSLAILAVKYWEDIAIYLIVHDMKPPCATLPHYMKRKSSSNCSKRFDVFVSYSSKDENWVVNSVVPNLCKKFNLDRICLYYKDFKAGEYLTETIVAAVDESQCTLLILSENFLKSEYCRLEFKKAHHEKLLRARRGRTMIAVTVGDVKNLVSLCDRELRFYLATNIYLRMEDERFWPKLLQTLPEPAAKCHTSSSQDVFVNFQNLASENFDTCL